MEKGMQKTNPQAASEKPATDALEREIQKEKRRRCDSRKRRKRNKLYAAANDCSVISSGSSGDDEGSFPDISWRFKDEGESQRSTEAAEPSSARVPREIVAVAQDCSSLVDHLLHRWPQDYGTAKRRKPNMSSTKRCDASSSSTCDQRSSP